LSLREVNIRVLSANELMFLPFKTWFFWTYCAIHEKEVKWAALDTS